MWTKYATATGNSGLKEVMETERPITEKTFKALIKSKIYKYYGYDDRIPANVYLLEDMQHNYGLPLWLHEYKEKKYIY